MKNFDPGVRIVFVHGPNSAFHSILPIRVQFWCSLGASSSLGNVYSRQDTESVNCENYSVFFVMKYCPTSTVVRNPAPVQIIITLSCCDNFSIHSLYLCNRSSSRCAGSLVKGMCVFITLGTNNELDCPFTTGRPVLSWQDSHSSQISATAP